MLGRIMVGKLVEGMGGADVADVLRGVPLPSDPGSGVADAVAWVGRALEELQRVGCAERFSVEAFMGEAVGFAAQWAGRGKRGEPEKVNYTWSRTFP
ncbi:hypothetical protein BU26DRAFT_437095 [Trematosphaeria pertusa]|uniref:Uncharacterized protein n=1 Tax=Trematosphaeria pertusa TaxID=390896 RepID=A0A6A6I0J4_9PLEO|nr:uncharacterized protein BU26DRAFT_437095 [Trematosphaeria pertusa]KAF2243502.1 hypothetical protein BU26DRAFT_437095 [Trematosphaeria pertusa]